MNAAVAVIPGFPAEVVAPPFVRFVNGENGIKKRRRKNDDPGTSGAQCGI